MNVDRGSEMFGDHRGAFDMPARPPGAPWRIPAHFAICRLPENNIRLVALVARLVDAGMIPTFGLSSENALRIFGRVEEDVSVDAIGLAGVNEPFDHLDNPAHMFGGAGLQRPRHDGGCAPAGLVMHRGDRRS